jgi:hypothetical protein
MAVGGMKDPVREPIRRIVAAVDLPARDRAVLRRAQGDVTVAVAGPAGPVAGLAQALYADFYCVPQAPASAATYDDAAFAAALRAANPVETRFEDGWTVVRIDRTGIMLAAAHGRQRLAALADILPYGGGIAPGQPVRAAVPREMTTGPGGHYIILGRPIHDARAGRQVRFYWNFGPDGAAPFLASLGPGLDRRRIPFQAKVPSAPHGYGRADCGVLYLDAEDVEAASDGIASAYDAVGGAVRPDTPLFARRLAPGLAFAESPPSGESFGMQRCRLVAEGLVAAFDRRARGSKARCDAVCQRLTGYGLDLAALERNPATAYPYRFERFAA